MTVISTKSITGVTSITSPQSDDAVTLHTNDTTQRVSVTTGGMNVTGVVTTTGGTFNGDVTFTGSSSNMLWRKANNALRLYDNVQLNFGNSDEGDIYRDSTQMIVNNANGNLKLRSNSIHIAGTSNEKHIVSNTGLGVTVYYNNSARLATTNSGVDITGDVTMTNTSSNPQLALISAANGIGEIQFGDANDAVRGNIVYRAGSAGDALCFNGYNNSEKMRIASGGEVLIGHDTVLGHNGVDGYLQITGTGSDSSSFNLNRFSADNWCPFITFGKSRNGAKGSHTVVQDNDYIGYIQFAASDGTDFNNAAANIICQIDGTPGTDDTPGRLIFKTCADGTNSPSERLRIDSAGIIKCGTSGVLKAEINNAVSGHQFISQCDDNETGFEVYQQHGSTATRNTFACYDNRGDSASKQQSFAVRGDGVVLMQATSSSGSSDDNIGFTHVVHGTSPYIRIRHQASNSTGHTIFHMLGASGNLLGEIKQDGSGGVTYHSASDYRLKENVVDLTGAITRIKNLKPKRFNFKVNTDVTQDGFLAHELQEVVPIAVSGTKDEVVTDDSKSKIPTLADKDIGDPVYQTVDTSRVVPLLTAALQEAITKIETLETKVAALEGS